MKYLFKLVFFSVFLFILACDRPNSNPELMDPIFADIEKQLKDAENELKSALQSETDTKDGLAKVKPQTGQIKFAQKRYYEAMARVQKTEQRVEFLKLRLKSRKQLDHDLYLKAYQKKQPWPPPEEWAEYVSQKNLESAPRSWNAKDRIEKATQPPPKPAEHGEH